MSDAPGGAPPSVPADPSLPAGVVERFGERIAGDLRRRPLVLEPVDHRRQVGRLLQMAGELTYFELLEVGAGCTPEEVAEAYEHLARRVHPDNAARLGIAGIEGRLADLFAWATRAYLTLSDPERRAEYLRVAPRAPLAGASGGGPEREAERRRVATEGIARARVAEESGDVHFAIELLEAAALAAPSADTFEELGRLQERNPNWNRRAAANYARALELDPSRSHLRAHLAELEPPPASPVTRPPSAAAAGGPGGRLLGWWRRWRARRSK